MKFRLLLTLVACLVSACAGGRGPGFSGRLDYEGATIEFRVPERRPDVVPLPDSPLTEAPKNPVLP